MRWGDNPTLGSDRPEPDARYPARRVRPRARQTDPMDGRELWLLRAIWLVLPVLVGPGLADALEPRSDAVSLVVEIGAWAGWFAGLVAWLVPSPASLTVVRSLTPALPVGLVAATVTGAWSATVGVAIAASLMVTALVFNPLVGDPMVDASSYGPERRLALRPPAGATIAAPLLWLVAAAGVVAGPIVVAAGAPVAGILLAVIGWPAAFWIGRGLHRLSRRWLVFVPAGFVVHDRQLLAEPVLVPRARVARLGPAPAEGERLDLTGSARGLSLELRLHEPLDFGVREGRDIAERRAERVLVTPSLPNRVIHQARVRGIKTD